MRKIFDDDFEAAPRARSAIWEPSASTAPTPVELPPLPAELEASLFQILRRPVDPELGHHDDFTRRERELEAIFDQLSRAAGLQLQQRLAISAPDDALAAAFTRLTLERRNRLVAYLGARRRRR